MTPGPQPQVLEGIDAADALVAALPNDTFAQLCGRGRLVIEARVTDGAALWRGQPWGSEWSGGGEPAALARLTAAVRPETLTVPVAIGLPSGYERGWGWGWHALRRPIPRQPGEEAVGWVDDDGSAGNELRALVASAFPDAESPPGDPRILRWFGARIDGRLVAAAAELRTTPETALLSSLTVDPAMRRAGWGSAVTTWFARTRFDEGACIVGLGRYLTNTRARALYARLGFLDVEYVGGTRSGDGDHVTPAR